MRTSSRCCTRFLGKLRGASHIDTTKHHISGTFCDGVLQSIVQHQQLPHKKDLRFGTFPVRSAGVVQPPTNGTTLTGNSIPSDFHAFPSKGISSELRTFAFARLTH